METAESILKRYWGHSNFRPLQKDIIDAVLAKKDVLALLPTGGGKSICFQVPALLTEGVCLVVSPLIALIKDQVENLEKLGINALAIYSGMNYADIKKTLKNAAYGNYKFLYLSPERLETDLFLEYLPAIKPSIVAVDEAHCISQWGYDFRPSYLRISSLRNHLPDANIIAVTASATPEVQEDICKQLEFKTGFIKFQQSFVRKNLSYSIFNPVAKQTKLLEILKNVKGSSIVYCKSRRITQDITALLKMHKISAAYYHAGLDKDNRSKIQESWVQNETACIVCTNAFGMGIDKPNVRLVVHYDVPESIENYYQEAGRAGRDGNRAYAVMLFEQTDITDLGEKVDLKFPSYDYLKLVYTSLMNNLQIAAGIGQGNSYSFDLVLFSNYFKLNAMQAANAIQGLAQEGLLTYNEVFFKPSTLVFKVNKNDLYEFYIQHPNLEEISKALLRTYEGIFDFPVNISEAQMANFLKLPIDSIKEQLTLLKNYQVVDYKAASENQEIFLLQNRMYSDDFKIDLENLHARKVFFEKRIKSMIDYLRNNIVCRNMFISNYFGDSEKTECGICDNCINNKKAKENIKSFSIISSKILEYLSNDDLCADDIIKCLNNYTKNEVWETINYLITERVIYMNKENKMSLVKRGKI